MLIDVLSVLIIVVPVILVIRLLWHAGSSFKNKK